ncbi:hypothetical protein PANT_9d00208 [Moesziomyces antarcticus T-34]|uniref:Uncharacterized protein n=1 Tax=Pseudozyma antarctica (strain T-34) TaxID=1151754 RepID=M9LNY2_PSEA3|nr:hypothetical protein PANT_9d00208 [Moesziomyces antarcticus T-34]
MSGNSGPPGSISFYRSNVNIFLGDVRHAGNGSNARLNLGDAINVVVAAGNAVGNVSLILGDATNAGVAAPGNFNLFLGDARHAVVAGNTVTVATDPDQSTASFRTQHLVPEQLFKPFEGSARQIPGFLSIEHGRFVNEGVTGNTMIVWAVARRDAAYVIARAMGLTGYQAVQMSPALYDILEEITRIRTQMCNEVRDVPEDAEYHLGIDEDEDCTDDEANLAE